MEANQLPKPGKLSKMRSLLPLIPALEVRLCTCFSHTAGLWQHLQIAAALPPDDVQGCSPHRVMRKLTPF